MSKTDKNGGKRRFATDRRLFSYTTSVSAMSRDNSQDGDDHVISDDMLSPWDHTLPNMLFERHSHGAVAIGKLNMFFKDALEKMIPRRQPSPCIDV